jgi:hypothetical protein
MVFNFADMPLRVGYFERHVNYGERNSSMPKCDVVKVIVATYVVIMVVLLVISGIPSRKSKETIDTIRMVHKLGGITACIGPYIRVLDLRSCNVGDYVFSELFLMNGLVRVERVDLSNTNITDASLIYCKAMPRLKVIKLSNTFVTLDGIEYYISKEVKVEWTAKE